MQVDGVQFVAMTQPTPVHTSSSPHAEQVLPPLPQADVEVPAAQTSPLQHPLQVYGLQPPGSVHDPETQDSAPVQA